MKPLIRYTIGRVGEAGWVILSESLRQIRKVYPEFDVVVCHNKLTSLEAERLQTMDVDLLRQDDLPQPFDFKDDDSERIRNFCWKLIPPRIRQDSHELWVDNDIIIRDRIQKIDDWLSGSTAIISTGFNHDYGKFTEFLIDKEPYCAGFFGLPPHFNFGEEIMRLYNGFRKKKKFKGYDEQGLVSLVVSSFADYIVLPQSDLPLIAEKCRMREIRRLPGAIHFARANRFDDHFMWALYKTLVMP